LIGSLGLQLYFQPSPTTGNSLDYFPLHFFGPTADSAAHFFHAIIHVTELNDESKYTFSERATENMAGGIIPFNCITHG
jgi:hypothetical protein